jgi:hypothetical protein
VDKRRYTQNLNVLEMQALALALESMKATGHAHDHDGEVSDKLTSPAEDAKKYAEVEKMTAKVISNAKHGPNID